MVIEALLREGTGLLKEAGIETARLDAEVLLMHLIKKDRLYLLTHRDEETEPDIEASYKTLIHRRVQQEPVSYITGEKEFMSLPFFVRPGVLIPRPDTETLVEFLLERYEKEAAVNILDLCTGSGAIAISLAHGLKKSRVTAWDISPRCVKTARENAERNGVAERVTVLERDVLKAERRKELFDCVVSNPPYIETAVIEGLASTVRDFEPRLALDGGEDGLVFYRAILNRAKSLLKQGGLLAFEVGFDQGQQVLNLLESAGFSELGFRKDLAGVCRVVYGTRFGEA